MREEAAWLRSTTSRWDLADLASNDRPLFERVAERIREVVLAGTWRQGAMIPGAGPIAGRYGVSFGTVYRAEKILEAEGLIRTVNGRGTFVCVSTSQRRRDA